MPLQISTDFNPNTRREENFLTKPKRTIQGALRALVASVPVTVPGVDVSHWQGRVDWKAYKAGGYPWAAIKATEGIYGIDSEWERNWNEALANDVIIMPYHFFRSNLDGKFQAQHHEEIIAPLVAASKGRILGSGVDIETADSVSILTRRTRALDCLRWLAVTRKPAKYSSPYFWSTLIGDVPWAKDYYGWTASWTSAAEPSIPVGWTRTETLYWQYGISGKYTWCPASVPGIAGQVDVNRFLGTIEDLRKLAGWVEPTPAPLTLESLHERVKRIEERLGMS